MASPLSRFLSGMADTQDLEEHGFVIVLSEGSLRVETAASAPTIEPSVAEVASGYARSWSQGSDFVQRWAQVVLALDAIDLARLEDTPEGDQLLEALWDAAGGDASGILRVARLVDDASLRVMTLARIIGREIMDGTTTPYDGAHRIAAIVYEANVHVPVLDTFVYASSEWDGRPEDGNVFAEGVIAAAKEIAAEGSG